MRTSLTLAAAALLFAASAALAAQDKVDICHIPPGNPLAAHLITVGAPAVPAHLAHGDLPPFDRSACDCPPCVEGFRDCLAECEDDVACVTSCRSDFATCAARECPPE